MALTANTYSGIKSIQRGVTTIPGASFSATATITAVNTAKSLLNILGNSSANTTNDYLANGVLTNSTTLTFTRVSNGAYVTAVSWEIVEWY